MSTSVLWSTLQAVGPLHSEEILLQSIRHTSTIYAPLSQIIDSILLPGVYLGITTGCLVTAFETICMNSACSYGCVNGPGREQRKPNLNSKDLTPSESTRIHFHFCSDKTCPGKELPKKIASDGVAPLLGSPTSTRQRKTAKHACTDHDGIRTQQKGFF